MAKRFAGVTSTENYESIRETLQHEHYVQFLKMVKKKETVWSTGTLKCGRFCCSLVLF